MRPNRKARRAKAPPAARPILPVRADAAESMALAVRVPNYLDDVREDSLLDGLIGTNCGLAGGGWSNNVTGLGTFGRDKVMQGHFSEPYRISDVELSALYNGNDLAKRVVETVPKEMFRRGWVLVVPAEDDADAPDQPDADAAALEQPAGGESGPAAPGSPLVDPMGAAPDNASAKIPGAVDPSDAEPGNDGSREKVSPAAAGADVSDPMGQIPAKGPPAQGGKDRAETGGDAMTPASDRKPAPNAAPGDGDAPAKGDQSKGADLAVAAEAYAARLALKPRALEAMIFGRLFGGGLLIIGADDGADMATPLREDEIKTIRYLAWVDRRFIFASSWYADIGPKYGEVATWQIVNPFGGQTNTVVHESRVIRFDGAPVDFLMRRRLLGWTLSVLQAPYDTLRQFDMSFQSIANLMADMSQATMKINGLAQLISNDQATLQTRMQMVDMSRSSGRMVYLDAENEEFKREPTPLTGVAETIQMQMLRTAAAAEQPVAILFGREPAGLNATGDADIRRFYDVTAGSQRTDLEPKLRRLYTLIFAAKDGPTAGVVPAKGVEFIWHKLYEPSELEQSEIRWNMAQADEKYVTAQVLLPEEVALARFRTGDLHLDTEIRTDLRDEALKSAELAPSGAEKAKQDQANKQAELQVKAAGVAAKTPPGGAKPKPAAGAKSAA